MWNFLSYCVLEIEDRIRSDFWMKQRNFTARPNIHLWKKIQASGYLIIQFYVNSRESWSDIMRKKFGWEETRDKMHVQMLWIITFFYVNLEYVLYIYSTYSYVSELANIVKCKRCFSLAWRRLLGTPGEFWILGTRGFGWNEWGNLNLVTRCYHCHRETSVLDDRTL